MENVEDLSAVNSFSPYETTVSARLYGRFLLFGNLVLGIVRRAFSCWHRHISRPFTLCGRTYEVCLDCGKELPYSLERMARVKEKC